MQLRILCRQLPESRHTRSLSLHLSYLHDLVSFLLSCSVKLLQGSRLAVALVKRHGWHSSSGSCHRHRRSLRRRCPLSSLLHSIYIGLCSSDTNTSRRRQYGTCHLDSLRGILLFLCLLSLVLGFLGHLVILVLEVQPNSLKSCIFADKSPTYKVNVHLSVHVILDKGGLVELD